jgi:hypothetical protein
MSTTAIARAAVAPRPPNSGTAKVLNGVSADSTTDAWAVGDSRSPAGAARTLIRHWNGVSWTKVASPNPGGTIAPDAFNQLAAVAAISPDDAWAVGFYGRSMSDQPHGLIVHWDGWSWTKVASPCTGHVMCFLRGVSFDAPNDGWAVGETSVGHRGESLMLHWNGSSWTRVASPKAGVLYGVSADSPTDAWAVGYWGRPTTEALLTVAMHWDGTSWTKVRTPNPAGSGIDAENLLSGVTALSATNAWAVGSFKIFGGATTTLVLHWDGTRWSRVCSPSPGGRSGGSVSELNGVSAASGRDVWAVGDSYNGSKERVKTLILYWDGGSWTKVPSPNPAGSTFPAVNRLYGVSADTGSDAWAVGQASSKPLRSTVLFLHWNGVGWSSA